MDDVINALEYDRFIKSFGSRVKMSPSVENFLFSCPQQVKGHLQHAVAGIKYLLTSNERLLITGWFENKCDRSSILFVVTRNNVPLDDRFRFVLSFHAPEFEYYCANSDFRRCLIKDEKWIVFAESLIGFRHRLD